MISSFSISSQELTNVNNKLSEANDEVMMHLREKSQVSDIRMSK